MGPQRLVHQLRKKLQQLQVGLAVTKLFVKLVTYTLEAGVFFVNTDNLGDSLVAFSGMVNELGLH